jgi:hypothetical protein
MIMRLGLGTWLLSALLALAYFAWAAYVAAEGFYQPLAMGVVVVVWLVWEAWRGP